MLVAANVTVTEVRTCAVTPRVRRDLMVSGARGTHDQSHFLLVRIATSAGIDGFGEVSATLQWSGEDAATAAHTIDVALAPAIIGRPLAPVADLELRMDRALAGSPFTKAGMAIGLWDAWARVLEVPLAVALGGPLRPEVAVKCSLSGDGDRLARTYRAAIAAGFRSFKVKVGTGLAADIDRVAAARELAGPDAFVGMDANGGYRDRQAGELIDAVGRDRPAFLEQPVAPADLRGMARVRDRGLPIIADESVFGMADLVNLIRADAADLVSVYVGKSGGPGRAVAMAQLADAHGLEVVVGSNGELGIGAAAQLHVACAAAGLSSWVPSDIIGGRYYEQDVLAGEFPSDGRVATLPDGPGLGVRLRPELLERLGAITG